MTRPTDTPNTASDIRLWALELTARVTNDPTQAFEAASRIATATLGAEDVHAAMRAVELAASMDGVTTGAHLLEAVECVSRFIRTGNHRTPASAAEPEAARQTTAA